MNAFGKIEGKNPKTRVALAPEPMIRPGDNRVHLSSGKVEELLEIARRKANPHHGLTGHERRVASEGPGPGEVKIISWLNDPQAVKTGAITLDSNAEPIELYEQCGSNDVVCLVLSSNDPHPLTRAVREESHAFLKENLALARG